MSLINTTAVDNMFLGHALEGLEKDVELLTQFIAHANGCGLESLDTATGKLIETGLAARYPGYFNVGDGLEGLGALADKLKQGIQGLKKMARGKAKPFIDKIAHETATEINNTYANSNWYKDKSAIGKPVSVASLANLVGDINSYADVDRQVKALLKTVDDHMKKIISNVNAYWGKAEPFYKRALKVKEDGVDKLISDIVTALPKRASQAFDEELPKLGGGKGETIDGLTVEQAQAIGKLLKEVMARCVHLANNASDVIEDCGISDAGAYDDIENKDLQREVWIRTFWEDYYMPVDRSAKRAADYCVQAVKELEKLIVNSVK